jgi:demethylmenaquinone methyltransferase/2-methoxy-6-polyprenyl-1,4-benzoquinol methylase
MSRETDKHEQVFGRNLSGEGGSKFEDSPIVGFAFKHLLHLLDSPVRRWFNDPVKTLEAAGVRPGLEVLEVGCGTGFFTIPAAEMVGDKGRLHAFDIHPLAVEKTANKIRDASLRNVRLTRTDALDTGLPDESYDLILLFGIIPAPVLPLNKLLPEMHRLLRPGGSMAVWTGLPLWSPRQVTRSGLFAYVGKRSGVHSFTRKG